MPTIEVTIHQYSLLLLLFPLKIIAEIGLQIICLLRLAINRIANSSPSVKTLFVFIAAIAIISSGLVVMPTVDTSAPSKSSRNSPQFLGGHDNSGVNNCAANSPK